MENIRFLLYLAVMGIVFLILTAIKALSPEQEYEPPRDEIGMRLYRPIFFGGKEDPVKTQIVKTEVKEIPEETPRVKTPVKEPEVVTEETVVVPKSDDDSYFSEMIRDYKANVLTKRKYRNDVVVRYYKHESDVDKALVLVDYGFYLHERPVDKTRYKSTNSNVLYYGREFPEGDLKLIAYLLVKNGIPIKRLQPFKNYDGWKKNALEIGGNPALSDRAILTYAQIRAYSALK